MNAPLEWAPPSNECPLNEADNLMSAPLEWAPPLPAGHVAYALILLMDLVHYAIVPKSNPDHHVDLRILIECRYGIVVSSS